jgi:hypothetical protein
MAVILDIADAVVAELNATAFSQPLTAERYYRPQFELSEMTELKVTVGHGHWPRRHSTAAATVSITRST